MVCGYLLNGLAVFAATEVAVMPLKVKVIFQQNILQNIEDVGGSLEVSVVLEVGHLTLAVPLHVPVEPLAGVVGAEHLDILQHVEVSVLPASLLAVPQIEGECE